MMKRRTFGREFKIEAVKLIRERGVSAAQAARDLDVHENVLRKWVKEFAADPGHAFPGLGQMKPEQVEIERLRLLRHRALAQPVQAADAGLRIDAFKEPRQPTGPKLGIGARFDPVENDLVVMPACRD